MVTRKPGVAAAIVDACHRLAEAGFVAPTDGNVSARLPGGNILTTPTGVNKGMVTIRDLIEVYPDGDQVKGTLQPSTELPMHLFIYHERSDVSAVVHAHPPYATAFATVRLPIEENLFPEVIIGFGRIPLAVYATPSTSEVADSIAPYVHASDAILLSNHGAVTYGTNPLEAFFKMQKVEHSARIAFIARMLGGGKQLTAEEVGRLKAAWALAQGGDGAKRLLKARRTAVGR